MSTLCPSQKNAFISHFKAPLSAFRLYPYVYIPCALISILYIYNVHTFIVFTGFLPYIQLKNLIMQKRMGILNIIRCILLNRMYRDVGRVKSEEEERDRWRKEEGRREKEVCIVCIYGMYSIYSVTNADASRNVM